MKNDFKIDKFSIGEINTFISSLQDQSIQEIFLASEFDKNMVHLDDPPVQEKFSIGQVDMFVSDLARQTHHSVSLRNLPVQDKFTTAQVDRFVSDLASSKSIKSESGVENLSSRNSFNNKNEIDQYINDNSSVSDMNYQVNKYTFTSNRNAI